ncbi:MAG: Rpn family recombination-promoting nuclease/putative transposase [Schwartzia sp.]|nr:Rpn family recombination-promoting nuclease/putative transposase [Schwartzia sp. (in: firmicutes)]
MGRIKEWEELTISDNFLFQKVMQNPRLCKRLIEKLLGIKARRLNYPVAEKTIEASPTQKGIRLDLYVETEDGTTIDIEMQTADKPLGWLPKRTRYYQAMIDLNVLGKGKDYIDLKMSFVIFICTFDPFPESGRKMYTFTSRCHEQEGLELGDETVKIFLNTKGKAGDVDEDIDKFLAYVDGKAAEGEFAQDVAAEVERVKQHNETRVEYMTLMMELKEQRREGYNEGVIDGENRGRNEGRNEGRVDNIVDNVRALVAKKGWSPDEAFDVLGVSPEDRTVVMARL